MPRARRERDRCRDRDDGCDGDETEGQTAWASYVHRLGHRPLVFDGTRVEECVTSRPEARVVRVSPDGRGGVVERQLPVRLLAAGEGHRRRRAETYAVSELRALRAGRNRWD